MLHILHEQYTLFGDCIINTASIPVIYFISDTIICCSRVITWASHIFSSNNSATWAKCLIITRGWRVSPADHCKKERELLIVNSSHIPSSAHVRQNPAAINIAAVTIKFRRLFPVPGIYFTHYILCIGLRRNGVARMYTHEACTPCCFLVDTVFTAHHSARCTGKMT